MKCKELTEKIEYFLGFRLVAIEHLHNFQFVPNTETHDAVSIFGGRQQNILMIFNWWLLS